MKTSNVHVVRDGSAVKDEAVFCGGLLLAIIVFAAMMWMGTTSALATRINSFSGFMIPSQTLMMDFSDDLLWSLTLGGTPNSIKPDYFGGSWHLGLTKEDGTVVGWATNSSKSEEGLEGWLTGFYSSSLGEGNSPSHAFLVYDSTNNGWELLGTKIGSPQDLLDGDMFFTEVDILFDGVLGGVSNLPIYTSGTAYLPSMTVVIPEPATIAVLALGGILLRKRSVR